MAVRLLVKAWGTSHGSCPFAYAVFALPSVSLLAVEAGAPLRSAKGLILAGAPYWQAAVTI
jgi:hypothetical protein